MKEKWFFFLPHGVHLPRASLRSNLLEQLAEHINTVLLQRKEESAEKVADRYYRKLEGKYSLESTDPRESEIRAHLRP